MTATELYLKMLRSASTFLPVNFAEKQEQYRVTKVLSCNGILNREVSYQRHLQCGQVNPRQRREFSRQWPVQGSVVCPIIDTSHIQHNPSMHCNINAINVSSFHIDPSQDFQHLICIHIYV